MNKFFIRIVVLLLMPSLMADPATAGGLCQGFAPRTLSTSHGIPATRFSEEAVVPPILGAAFSHPSDPTSTARLARMATVLLYGSAAILLGDYFLQRLSGASQFMSTRWLAAAVVFGSLAWAYRLFYPKTVALGVTALGFVAFNQGSRGRSDRKPPPRPERGERRSNRKDWGPEQLGNVKGKLRQQTKAALAKLSPGEKRDVIDWNTRTWLGAFDVSALKRLYKERSLIFDEEDGVWIRVVNPDNKEGLAGKWIRPLGLFIILAIGVGIVLKQLLPFLGSAAVSPAALVAPVVPVGLGTHLAALVSSTSTGSAVGLFLLGGLSFIGSVVALSFLDLDGRQNSRQRPAESAATLPDGPPASGQQEKRIRIVVHDFNERPRHPVIRWWARRPSWSDSDARQSHNVDLLLKTFRVPNEALVVEHGPGRWSSSGSIPKSYRHRLLIDASFESHAKTAHEFRLRGEVRDTAQLVHDNVAPAHWPTIPRAIVWYSFGTSLRRYAPEVPSGRTMAEQPREIVRQSVEDTALKTVSELLSPGGVFVCADSGPDDLDHTRDRILELGLPYDELHIFNPGHGDAGALVFKKRAASSAAASSGPRGSVQLSLPIWGPVLAVAIRVWDIILWPLTESTRPSLSWQQARVRGDQIAASQSFVTRHVPWLELPVLPGIPMLLLLIPFLGWWGALTVGAVLIALLHGWSQNWDQLIVRFLGARFIAEVALLPVLTFRHNPSFHAPLPGFSLYPLASIPLIIWLYILFTGLYILFIVYALHRGWNYVMPAPYRLNLGEPPGPPSAGGQGAQKARPLASTTDPEIIAQAMVEELERLDRALWVWYSKEKPRNVDLNEWLAVRQKSLPLALAWLRKIRAVLGISLPRNRRPSTVWLEQLEEQIKSLRLKIDEAERSHNEVRLASLRLRLIQLLDWKAANRLALADQLLAVNKVSTALPFLVGAQGSLLEKHAELLDVRKRASESRRQKKVQVLETGRVKIRERRIRKHDVAGVTTWSLEPADVIYKDRLSAIRSKSHTLENYEPDWYEVSQGVDELGEIEGLLMDTPNKQQLEEAILRLAIVTLWVSEGRVPGKTGAKRELTAALLALRIGKPAEALERIAAARRHLISRLQAIRGKKSGTKKLEIRLINQFRQEVDWAERVGSVVASIPSTFDQRTKWLNEAEDALRQPPYQTLFMGIPRRLTFARFLLERQEAVAPEAARVETALWRTRHVQSIFEKTNIGLQKLSVRLQKNRRWEGWWKALDLGAEAVDDKQRVEPIATSLGILSEKLQSERPDLANALTEAAGCLLTMKKGLGSLAARRKAAALMVIEGVLEDVRTTQRLPGIVSSLDRRVSALRTRLAQADVSSRDQALRAAYPQADLPESVEEVLANLKSRKAAVQQAPAPLRAAIWRHLQAIREDLLRLVGGPADSSAVPTTLTDAKFSGGERVDWTQWAQNPNRPNEIYFRVNPTVRARLNPETRTYDVFGGGVPTYDEPHRKTPGKHLSPEELRDLLQWHRNRGDLLRVKLSGLGKPDPEGILERLTQNPGDRDKWLVKFEGKPEAEVYDDNFDYFEVQGIIPPPQISQAQLEFLKPKEVSAETPAEPRGVIKRTAGPSKALIPQMIVVPSEARETTQLLLFSTDAAPPTLRPPLPPLNRVDTQRANDLKELKRYGFILLIRKVLGKNDDEQVASDLIANGLGGFVRGFSLYSVLTSIYNAYHDRGLEDDATIEQGTTDLPGLRRINLIFKGQAEGQDVYSVITFWAEGHVPSWYAKAGSGLEQKRPQLFGERIEVKDLLKKLSGNNFILIAESPYFSAVNQATLGVGLALLVSGLFASFFPPIHGSLLPTVISLFLDAAGLIAVAYGFHYNRDRLPFARRLVTAG